MKIITPAILKSWNPCADGYKRFLELLPDGGDLQTCVDVLVKDGHDDWGYWLFSRCRKNEEFKQQTLNGYRNVGDLNTGGRNTGNWNTGNRNTGNWNTGDRNTGNLNTGNRNTGDLNTGDWNTGDRNTGNLNTGDRNVGNLNTGNWNTGDRNTGGRNTGDRNVGDWNTGNLNTGFFNSITPEKILVFNKPCDRATWDSCEKPKFIYFELNTWIYESEMSDQEKIDSPTFYCCGGYLKKGNYKEKFKESWDSASDEDRRTVLELPNFDADVFLEISGIDVKKELSLNK